MVFGISLAIAKPKFCINAIGQEQTGLRAWAPPKETEKQMREKLYRQKKAHEFFTDR